LVVAAFALCACSAEGLPTGAGTTGTAPGDLGKSTTGGTTTGGTNGGTTTGGTNGGTTTGGTNGGTTTGGTNGGGNTTGGGQGATCKTACDCMAGLGCFQGQCVSSMFGMLYCCSATTCPMGSFCQGADGNFGRCGSTMTTGGTNGGFGFDLGARSDGGGGFCGQIPCRSDGFCQMAGCGTCDMTTRRCQ
jgi:hypothetical protein